MRRVQCIDNKRRIHLADDISLQTAEALAHDTEASPGFIGSASAASRPGPVVSDARVKVADEALTDALHLELEALFAIVLEAV